MSEITAPNYNIDIEVDLSDIYNIELKNPTTTQYLCRGGSRGFVGAVCPAAPTQAPLQIMYL